MGREDNRQTFIAKMIKIQLNLCCCKYLKYFLLWPMPSFFFRFFKRVFKEFMLPYNAQNRGEFLIIVEDELTCESVGGNRAEQIGGQVQDF